MFVKYLVTLKLEVSTAEPVCPATAELFVALGHQHPEAPKERVGSGRAASFAIGCLIPQGSRQAASVAGGLCHSLLVVSFFCAALMSLAEEIQSLWFV